MALNEAERAQNSATKAIKQANEDIEGTQNLLTSVSYYLGNRPIVKLQSLLVV